MLSKNRSLTLPAVFALGLFLACGGDSKPAASTAPRIYAGGSQSFPISRPGYWAAGTWVALTHPHGTDGWVNALAVSGSDVYTAGWNAYVGGVDIGYWRNSTWIGLPPPAGADAAMLHAVAVADGGVYVGGEVYNLAKPYEATPGYWQNGQWIGLPLPEGGTGSVATLVVSGGDVYAGGRIQLGSTSMRPGYWRNGSWVELFGPDGPVWSYVTAMAVSGRDVYAAGAGGYWANGLWFDLLGPADTRAWINAITVSGSTVLVGGSAQDNANRDRSTPGYWENGTWIELPLPSGFIAGEVESLAVWGKDLYAAGFVRLPSVNGLPGGSVSGYWRNKEWIALTTTENGKLANASSLVLTR